MAVKWIPRRQEAPLLRGAVGLEAGSLRSTRRPSIPTAPRVSEHEGVLRFAARVARDGRARPRANANADNEEHEREPATLRECPARCLASDVRSVGVGTGPSSRRWAIKRRAQRRAGGREGTVSRVGGERRSARSIVKRSDVDSDGTVLAVIERDTMRRRVPTIIRRQSCTNVQTAA